MTVAASLFWWLFLAGIIQVPLRKYLYKIFLYGPPVNMAARDEVPGEEGHEESVTFSREDIPEEFRLIVSPTGVIQVGKAGKG